jgi:hypothetical protein
VTEKFYDVVRCRDKAEGGIESKTVSQDKKRMSKCTAGSERSMEWKVEETFANV